MKTLKVSVKGVIALLVFVGLVGCLLPVDNSGKRYRIIQGELLYVVNGKNMHFTGSCLKFTDEHGVSGGVCGTFAWEELKAIRGID